MLVEASLSSGVLYHTALISVMSVCGNRVYLPSTATSYRTLCYLLGVFAGDTEGDWSYLEQKI